MSQEESPIATCGLRPLVPPNLLPEAYSRHMQRLAQLKQIRALKVSVRSDKKKCIYTISSPLLQTNIPTRSKHTPTLSASASALLTEKQLADFVKLREELYHCALTSHPEKRCRFCNDVVKSLRVRVLHPHTLVLHFLPKDKQADVLDELLSMLLQLAISCPSNVSQTCRCQEQVPKRLWKFLFDA